MFRQTMEMRYRLMPYIYAQAKESSEKGLPCGVSQRYRLMVD